MTWTLEQYFQGGRKRKPKPEPQSLPLGIGELKLGWKYLSVEGDERMFVSPLYGTNMEPNKTMEAKCGVYGSDHDAPVYSCLCGFHMGSRANDPCLSGYKMSSSIFGGHNILGLFICSGRCLDHRSGFRAERALLAGVLSTDKEIAKHHPNLIMANMSHKLESKVREAYSNGYWHGSPVISGGPHTSNTGGYPSMGAGYYSRGNAYTSSSFWNNISSKYTSAFASFGRCWTLATNKPVSSGDYVCISTSHGSVTFKVPDRAVKLEAYSGFHDGSIVAYFRMVDNTIEYVIEKLHARPNL